METGDHLPELYWDFGSFEITDKHSGCETIIVLAMARPEDDNSQYSSLPSDLYVFPSSLLHGSLSLTSGEIHVDVLFRDGHCCLVYG